MLHTSDMKYKYMKRTEVLMPSLLAFVTCEGKKVKVTIQSFLLHLSRSVYFVTILQLLNNGAHINCVIIFKCTPPPFLLGG